MSPDDLIRLRHMVEAIDHAQRFCVGRQPTDLASDVMLRMALLHAVQIVGEAAARVSAQARAEVPGIEWTLIVAMRNRLVHAYFDVDTAILWATVQESLPALREQLRSVRGLSGSAPQS